MIQNRPSVKVLMTVDAVGGVWTYALGLARAALPHGVEFLLATMGPPPKPDQIAEARALPNVQLEVCDYRLEWMPDPWEDVAAAGEWLLDLERAHRPDLIHLNGFSHGALPFAAPVLCVGHSCCLSWWRAVKGEEPPAAWDEYRRRVRAGIAGAELFVAPSAAMLAAFRDLYAPLPPTLVVHNGADADAPIPNRKDPVILAAGRLWDEAKNIGLLSTVAPRLPWPVLVAGERDGPIGAPPPTAGLVRLGRLPQRDMQVALGRAAIYAHPALYEPFGLLPLEAALAGCALVLADIPTLRELWPEGALFADPRNADAWAAQIQSLIASPDALAATAAAARRTARRYSLSRFGRGYAAAYRQLLSATPTPSGA